MDPFDDHETAENGEVIPTPWDQDEEGDDAPVAR